MRDRGRIVLPILVASYAGLYLCRANVEAAFPLLRSAFGFSKTQLGLVSSISVAVYAVGKVVMGTLGDVIGGKRLVLVAIAGSVVASFAFGASGTLAAFVLFASVNRFFQSGGWSGVVGVVPHHFERERYGSVMGVLSTSYGIGEVMALLLCSAITTLVPGWRALFVVNPLVLAAVGVLFLWALDDPVVWPGPAPDAARSRPSGAGELAEIFAGLARQPWFWVTVTLSILLTFLRVSFLTWTATFLAELSRADGNKAVSGAIAKSAIFPAAGVVAALAIGPLTDRFGPGRRAPVMAVSLACVFGLVVALAHGGVHSPLVAAVVIGGVGLFLLGPYSLLAGAIALDVSGKRGASMAAGIIDGAGYVGGSAAGWLLGYVADQQGWSAVFDVVAAAALIAAGVTGAWSVTALRRSGTGLETLR